MLLRCFCLRHYLNYTYDRPSFHLIASSLDLQDLIQHTEQGFFLIVYSYVQLLLLLLLLWFIKDPSSLPHFSGFSFLLFFPDMTILSSHAAAEPFSRFAFVFRIASLRFLISCRPTLGLTLNKTSQVRFRPYSAMFYIYIVTHKTKITVLYLLVSMFS